MGNWHQILQWNLRIRRFELSPRCGAFADDFPCGGGWGYIFTGTPTSQAGFVSQQEGMVQEAYVDRVSGVTDPGRCHTARAG